MKSNPQCRRMQEKNVIILSAAGVNSAVRFCRRRFNRFAMIALAVFAGGRAGNMRISGNPVRGRLPP